MCHCIDAIRGHAGKQRRAKYFKHDPQGNLARLSSFDEFAGSMVHGEIPGRTQNGQSWRTAGWVGVRHILTDRS